MLESSTEVVAATLDDIHGRALVERVNTQRIRAEYDSLNSYGKLYIADAWFYRLLRKLDEAYQDVDTLFTAAAWPTPPAPSADAEDVAALLERLTTGDTPLSGVLTIQKRHPSWGWRLSHGWLGEAEGETLAAALAALIGRATP